MLLNHLFSYMNSQTHFPSVLFACISVVLAFMVFCAGCTTTSLSEKSGISIATLDDRTGNAIATFAEQYQESTQIPVNVALFSSDEWKQVSYQEYDLIIVNVADLRDLVEQNIVAPITMMDDGLLTKTTFDAIMLHPYIFGSDLYGLPLQPDMLGYVIWGELFTDENEIAAFKETYGYDIGNPLTYHELLTIIKFISRPENERHGIGFAGDESNTLQNLHESIVCSYGSEPIDAERQEAEAIFQELIANSAPEHMTWSREDVTDALLQRKIQSAITWFSEFETMSSPEYNPENDKFIFLPLPGSWDRNGVFHSSTILDGQVFAVPHRSHAEKRDMLAFLNWFYQPDIQLQWMQAGMQPMIHEIQESWEYLMANGYNAAYIISLRNAWKSTS